MDKILDFIWEVLQDNTVTAFWVTMLMVLVKFFTSHLLSKDIVKFQQTLTDKSAEFQRSLQSSAELEMSAYKAELDKERVRLQISYGGIFKKQAETIIELYRLIADLRQATIGVTIDSESADSTFHEKWQALYFFSLKNRILLPESVEDLLRKLQLDSISGFLTHSKNPSPSGASMLTELAKIEATLKDELRLLIGVQERK